MLLNVSSFLATQVLVLERISQAPVPFSYVVEMGYCLSLVLVGLLFFDLCANPWCVTAPRGCLLCSTSFPGGNQVDGLPPA